jgi:hypothetical protein
MVIKKNFKVSNLLLTKNDGALRSSKITSTSTVKVTIGKGMIFKHVPPQMGLLGLVVTIGCFLGLGPKVDDPFDGSNLHIHQKRWFILEI